MELGGFFYLVGRRPKRRSSSGGKPSAVNWFLMRPCVGIVGLCPPLCTWAQLTDGTYSLADVERFNQTIGEIVEAAEKARQS